MNDIKMKMINKTVSRDISMEAISVGADVLIGLSAANVFTEKIVKSLGRDPIIFALAYPTPEIDPQVA